MTVWLSWIVIFMLRIYFLTVITKGMLFNKHILYKSERKRHLFLLNNINNLMKHKNKCKCLFLVVQDLYQYMIPHCKLNYLL